MKVYVVSSVGMRGITRSIEIRSILNAVSDAGALSTDES